jgi:hypothetical protein
MGNLLTERVGNILTTLLGNVLTTKMGKVLDIYILTVYAVVDRIISHLRLTFVAERPPPPHVVLQEFLMDSETGADYLS